MPDETWESVTAPTVETPAALVVEPSTPEPVTNPPAIASTLETAPQLEAEPVVRESESQAVAPEPVVEAPKEQVKDEDVEEGDTPEIKALPSGSSSRKWARRQYHDATAIRDFIDYDKPISALGDELHKRSASRYTAHVNDIFRRHSKDLLGIPFEEVKTRLRPNGTPVTTPAATVAAPVPEVSLPTEAEIGNMENAEVAARFQQVSAAQVEERKRIESEFQSKVDALQQQFDAVNGKLNDGEKSAQQAEITGKQNELLNNVLSVVDEVIRDTGLEVQANDPPKIASLKRAGAALLDRQRVLAAFDAVPDNGRVVKYAIEAINRREYQNAFREEDNLKVRARVAAESITQGEELKAILEEINAFAAQSTAKSRAANPIPPAPGSALGVAIKPPATWDEAVAAA